jgi:CheY-like chemotaxis protein
MTRLRILVVEDEADIRKFYRALLFEHEVVEAASLSEGRAARADGEFDVVIADWNLPDGVGGTLLEELASMNDCAHRIVHSGAEPLALEELLERGVVHQFFPKPSWFELNRHLTHLGDERLRTRRHSIPASEKRETPRVPLPLTVFLRCPTWPAVRRLYTEDLSQGGLSIRSAEPAPVGTRVSIALILPEGTRLRFKGEVRHVAPMAHRDGTRNWRIGIRLDDAHGRKRIVLRALLRSSSGSAAAIVLTPPHAA